MTAKPQNDTHSQAGRSDLRRSATKAQECGSSDNSAASQSSKPLSEREFVDRVLPILEDNMPGRREADPDSLIHIAMDLYRAVNR